MRLATFNVENMFERAKAMNLDTWDEGKNVLEDFQRLNTLIQQETYDAATKDELLTIMKRHRGLITNGVSKFIRFRDIRGKFLYRPKNKPAEIVADGRADWIGWFELEKEAVKESATENTARIIGLLQTDIICVVEAENRIGLKRFNEDVLAKVQVASFQHIMLIDGNDDRGIDVGIMTRDGYNITCMRSHVDDADADGIIFSRDCPEYEITTPNGNKLLLLINHLKSKGFGSPTDSNAKRTRQTKQLRKIYDAKRNDYDFIALLGDFNENPDLPPMDALLREGSDLTDIMTHAKFVGDGRPGTFGNGTASGKLDYILMSPKLAEKVVQGGIERRGVWGGVNGTLFPHLPTIKSAKDAASDHAALWAELDI